MKGFASIFLLFSISAFAQKKDTVLKYFDASLNPTTRKNAVYMGAAIKQPDGWYVFALYPDTSFVFKAYSKDKALTSKEGPYEVFYPKNKPVVAGSYHDNIQVGVWRTWYENGQLKDSGLVDNNIRMGLWKSWYRNGQLKEETTFKNDSVMQLLRARSLAIWHNDRILDVKHGAHRSWYETGILESTGVFVNDSMDGVWNWYYENGKPSAVETYRNGKVIALTCFDSLGNDAGALCSIAKPPLLRQYGDWRSYVQQNLMWPKEALKKHISGKVRVTFRVTKEGKLDRLVIL